MIEKFRTIFEKYNGSMYNVNFLSLLSTLYLSLRPFRKPNGTILHTRKLIFCSQLAAITYKELGLLDESLNPRNVLPIDFIPNVDQDKEIPTYFMSYPIRFKDNEIQKVRPVFKENNESLRKNPETAPEKKSQSFFEEYKGLLYYLVPIGGLLLFIASNGHAQTELVAKSNFVP